MMFFVLTVTGNYTIMRRCQKCKKLKCLSDFVRRSDRLGYYTWCDSCRKIHGRECGWPKHHLRGGGLADGGMKTLLES